MDAARTLRLAAAGFVILAITLTGLQLRHPAPPDPPAPVVAPSYPLAGPRAAELARCQGLGEAGARDTACLAAWAQSRRRFLGLTPDPTKE
ncbi:MAG: putative entry exclusion protein TrbK-alt [Pseudomonadota bacterium]